MYLKKVLIFGNFSPAIVTIGCKVYLISKDDQGFGSIRILTESSWKPMREFKSKFSSDMENGSFTSSSIHCSDVTKGSVK